MKKMMILLSLLVSSISCMGKKVDNSTVGTLQLDRYLGSWYEIARIDHSFEKGLTHATALYSLKDDGTVSVINCGMKDGKLKKSQGKAKLTETPGLLRVSFFGPFYSDYRVLMVTDDYRYALVGSGNGNYLWILSRVPEVAPEILDLIVDVAKQRGYDTDRLVWVDQR